MNFHILYSLFVFFTKQERFMVSMQLAGQFLVFAHWKSPCHGTNTCCRYAVTQPAQSMRRTE